MIRRRLLSCTLALLLGGGLVAPAAAQTEAPARTVRVGGEGTVTAAPDRAVVRFGVVTRANEPEAARARNATAAKNALNAVRELGVPEENLRMETLRLQPRREYDREADSSRIVGYEASRQVVAQLNGLEQLPRVVARVVQQGANRLEGVQYQLSDRTAARNDALRQAARSARDKAELLAETLGAQLGPVRQISEQDFSFNEPSPRVNMEMAKAATADAAPEPDAYAAGEIEVSAQVEVVFELATP